ncbi:MAG: 6-phosphogluconolactonase/glucosamine-6-phosphate isomerase/deaminase [Planctomycetota bacterium]|nr:6-phosphogluconolactonase/glucosamine-6-phosphate isomerase/deaminase [Planctomycetota bacterium]
MPDPYRTLDTKAGTALIFAEGDIETAARTAADLIRAAVDAAGAKRGRAVLGLATGSTPIPVYAHLVARHRDGDLKFNGVMTYNLDEYYPISPRDPNSYRTFMHRHLFSQVEIAANQSHVFDGTVPESAVGEHAAQFEKWIAADGGLDLQLLGIGRNGHIGFNEPSELSVADALALPSRVVSLHPVTTADAARDFGGEPDRVPERALTMGVATILSAREILILAFGAAKADAVARSLLGPITAQVPGSLLQTVAPKVTWILDEAAASGLRGRRPPPTFAS